MLASPLFHLFCVWCAGQSSSISQGVGHSKRAPISPFPKTPLFICWSPMHFIYTCTPLPYSCTYQVMFIQEQNLQLHSHFLHKLLVLSMDKLSFCIVFSYSLISHNFISTGVCIASHVFIVLAFLHCQSIWFSQIINFITFPRH